LISTVKEGLTRGYTECIVLVMEGKELLEIRKSLGLTQVQIAERIGVTSNTVARWERGEVRISEPVSKLILLLAGSPRKASKKARRKDG
jgi:DNA-binding transcriptional regulator YiaG